MSHRRPHTPPQARAVSAARAEFRRDRSLAATRSSPRPHLPPRFARAVPRRASSRAHVRLRVLRDIITARGAIGVSRRVAVVAARGGGGGLWAVAPVVTGPTDTTFCRQQ